MKVWTCIIEEVSEREIDYRNRYIHAQLYRVPSFSEMKKFSEEIVKISKIIISLFLIYSLSLLRLLVFEKKNALA